MIINTEIEFKNALTKEQYDMFLDYYKIRDIVYKQVNYYFDTDDKSLLSKFSTLRIRFKEPNYYKLTLKDTVNNESLEKNYVLSEKKAKELIENGFNLKEYFDIDIDVKYQGELTTYRTRAKYRDGELFFDKIVYDNIVDYEVEYEVLEHLQGKKDFKDFLKEFDIPKNESIKKVTRILGAK